MVIDEFAEDTSEVIRYARETARFRSDSTSVYPGVRAKPTSSYLNEIVRAMAPVLSQLYAVPEGRRIKFSTFYSLVATPPDELHVLQRIPHFDSNSPHVAHRLRSSLDCPDMSGTSSWCTR